jgi:hypothetical protein
VIYRILIELRYEHFDLETEKWREIAVLSGASGRRMQLPRKNPRPSQIVYSDEFQVAILPTSTGD